MSFLCEMTKEKDQRYKTVKLLIENKHIQEFNQIFDLRHIPRSVVANYLGTNYNRLVRLLIDIDDISFSDVYKLSEFFEVKEMDMIQLVHNQHIKNKSKKSSRKK